MLVCTLWVGARVNYSASLIWITKVATKQSNKLGIVTYIINYYLRSIRDTSFHIQCLAASHARTRVATAWWEGVVKGLGGAYGHIKAFEFSLIPTSKESLLLLKACWDDKLERTRILLHTDIVACTCLHYYVWLHHLHVSKRAQRSSKSHRNQLNSV